MRKCNIRSRQFNTPQHDYPQDSHHFKCPCTPLHAVLGRVNSPTHKTLSSRAYTMIMKQTHLSILCSNADTADLLNSHFASSEKRIAHGVVYHCEKQLCSVNECVQILDKARSLDKSLRYIVQDSEYRLHINRKGQKKVTKGARKIIML